MEKSRIICISLNPLVSVFIQKESVCVRFKTIETTGIRIYQAGLLLYSLNEKKVSHQSIFGKTDRAKALPDNYGYLLLLLFYNRLKRIPFALKQIQTNTDGNSLSYYILSCI